MPGDQSPCGTNQFQRDERLLSGTLCVTRPQNIHHGVMIARGVACGGRALRNWHLERRDWPCFLATEGLACRYSLTNAGR